MARVTLGGDPEQRGHVAGGVTGKTKSMKELANKTRFLSTRTPIFVPKSRGYLYWLRKMPTDSLQICFSVFIFISVKALNGVKRKLTLLNRHYENI